MSLTKANTRMLEGDLPASQITGELPVGQVPTIPNSKLENSSVTINGSAVALGGSTTIATGGGKIGQVLQSVLTTKVAATSQSFIDIGLSVSITPSATSSKILVSCALMLGSGITGSNNFYQMVRGSTVLQLPQQTRNPDTVAAKSYVSQLLDSPSSTSELTYKIQCKAEANEFFVNRNGSNTQNGYSTITVMEVLA